MNSVYTAALTFVGQNVGAGKYARIKKISFLCVGLVTFIGVSLGVVLVVFGEKLLLIFATGENKDAVVKAGMNRLLVMGTTYFLCGLMDVGCGIMRGMGKTILPMIVSLVGSCLFRIVWIATVCPLFPGNILALYISYPISWFITAAVHYGCCIHNYRALMRRGAVPAV